MHRAGIYVLFPPSIAAHPWRIGKYQLKGSSLHDVSAPSDLPSSSNVDAKVAATDMAVAVAQALTSLGHHGEPVVLALPSTWCLAATIPAGDLPRRRAKSRRRLLLFRFEEYLPIAAELILADFADSPAKISAANHHAAARADTSQSPVMLNAQVNANVLGVATEVSPVAALLARLASAGVLVDRVCPAALLAVQSVIGKPSPHVIIWAGAASEIEVILLRGGTPFAWSLLRSTTPGPPTSAAVERYLAATLPPHGDCKLPGLAIGLAICDNDALIQWTCSQAESIQAAAVRAAGLIANGRGEPWIDLLRQSGPDAGTLEYSQRWRSLRRPLIAAGAAALFMLLCLGTALELRARAYAQLASNLHAQQMNICQTAIGRQPPAGLTPRARLASEVRRLSATSDPNLSDMTGPSSPQALQPPILDALRGVLAALVTGTNTDISGPRFRLLDVQLAPNQLLLEGECRNHGDTDALDDKLRRLLGDWYTIDAPRTQVQEKAASAATTAGGEVVGFTITGQAASPASNMAPSAALRQESGS